MCGNVCQANYGMDDAAEKGSRLIQRLQSAINTPLPSSPTPIRPCVSYLGVQDSITPTVSLFAVAAAPVWKSKRLHFIVQHTEQRNTLEHARCSAHKVIGI